jgi:hypothetical protein
MLQLGRAAVRELVLNNQRNLPKFPLSARRRAKESREQEGAVKHFTLANVSWHHIHRHPQRSNSSILQGTLLAARGSTGAEH